MLKIYQIATTTKVLKEEYKKMLEICTAQPNEILYLKLLSRSIYSLKELKKFIYESGLSKVIK